MPFLYGHDGDVGHVEGSVALQQAANAAHLDHDCLWIGGLADPQVAEVVQVDVVGVMAHVGGDGLLALQAPGPPVGCEGEFQEAVLGPQGDPRGDVLVEQQSQAVAVQIRWGGRCDMGILQS